MMKSVTNSGSSRGIAAIVGVGPKLGRSIARKFAHEGYTVAILARDLGRLSRLAEEIAREEMAQLFAIRIDCSDSKSVRDAFEGVLSLGFMEVLVYNVDYHHSSLSANSNYSNPPTYFQHLPLDTFKKSLAVSSVGAFHCAQQMLVNLMKLILKWNEGAAGHGGEGKGTIIFTGCSASLNGIAGYSQLCCGKFALRGLAQCLAREFQTQGVHIAHVIIDGLVGPPCRQKGSSVRGQTSGERGDDDDGIEGTMDPDAVAQTYWHLHLQDRNAWTQEIDLRSSTATFF